MHDLHMHGKYYRQMYTPLPPEISSTTLSKYMSSSSSSSLGLFLSLAIFYVYALGRGRILHCASLSKCLAVFLQFVYEYSLRNFSWNFLILSSMLTIFSFWGRMVVLKERRGFKDQVLLQYMQCSVSHLKWYVPGFCPNPDPGMMQIPVFSSS